MQQSLVLVALTLFFFLFIGTSLGGLCDTPDSSYFTTTLSAFPGTFSQPSEGGEIETDCSSESDSGMFFFFPPKFFPFSKKTFFPPFLTFSKTLVLPLPSQTIWVAMPRSILHFVMIRLRM